MLSDTLWHLEHAKTVASIQASQWRFWLRGALLMWCVCTLLVLMIGLNAPERKRNVVTWVIASVSPLRTVAWQGKQYDPRELARWMDGALYDGTLGQWLTWAMQVAVLPVVLMGSGGWWYVRKKENHEKHIRGAEVVSVNELQQRLQRVGKPGLRIAGVTIPAELECQHFIVCGATGAGKSVTLRDRLRQIADRGEPCIVVDPGEFVREFYDEARGDYLLNPLDARCPTWRPEYEGTSEEAMAAQAASLFPVLPGMSNAAVFYHESAQRAYRELLQQVGQHEPCDLPKLLSELIAKRKVIIPREVVPTLHNALDGFRYLRPGTRAWSAGGWVQDPQGWIFLTFRKKERAAVIPLISFWLECLTRELLSREIQRHSKIVHLVIDELAALGIQPTLSESMAEGRKYLISVCLGFQDKEGLDALYGKGMANNILNQPSTALLMKSNDAATQAWCEGRIGQREMQRAVEGEVVGPAFGRDSISRTHARIAEPAVLASDFGQLQNLDGYLKVAHFGVSKVSIPYVGMIENVPAFIPRTEEKPREQDTGKIYSGRRAI